MKTGLLIALALFTTGAVANEAVAPAGPRATLSGWDPDEYYEELPPLRLELVKQSPHSLTYLRVYPGAGSPAPQGALIIEGSVVINNDEVARDHDLLLKNVNDELTRHGIHTAEVVQVSSAGIQVLFRGSINLDRTMILPGGLYLAE